MKFVAFERAKQGTGASRRLRNTGRTPGIVFGGSTEPTSIELDHNALWFTLQKEAFHASLLEMELNGKTEIVLLRDVQYHPFKQLVLHVDFQRVDAKTRLHKKVPLHFINGETSPAVKLDRSVVNHVMTELEVECLATDLPEHIEIDLGESVKGSTLHVTDLKLPKGIKAVTHGKKNQTVVTFTAPPGGYTADAAAEPAAE
ncbi:MAG: 50S ribosomal protein L25/general stress protein Ctc [Burkholderiaceae bacterium]|jgi:large subunit ribosomal protein L25|nr:50S ribosomal protein L25/general stress protein Ctc [Burkholderiaceae bacterium]MDO7649251.1 50S ribosomal protein L25/general stress protein Ctc [Burkholderiaceae bacterium]MDO7670222.1 50S ribosomal protein L25/general stress protein Ctc [Burkholderiaceae bacterium]MDP5022704.1 50S ribosomal protein L25/general stress protein Ctc [Burkholderiaceae bacterium]|tara:strand:+ start:516 stop:1118 length:603 start_codon:yes stop_codon:yes gene_type:complete